MNSYNPQGKPFSDSLGIESQDVEYLFDKFSISDDCKRAFESYWTDLIANAKSNSLSETDMKKGKKTKSLRIKNEEDMIKQ